jgi:2-polyprenyl-6-methoxyphenol hydroxylase-like FAD-dependent oxidoreductase
MARFDVAILGAGAAGLTAALRIARSGRSVLLVASRPPQAGDGRRVDAVPARYLAFLAELGLPRDLVGADRAPAIRCAAWESVSPESSVGPATAHVERPALELALLALLRREHRATIRFEQQQFRQGDSLDAGRWGAGRLIDASGRATVTASKRVKPSRPWVARTFWTERARCKASAAFAITAMPDGYAYRLGTASTVTVGIVGRGASALGSPRAIECRLREAAPWFSEGLPALADMRANKAKPASVQWSEGCSGLRIGDAALARDALSSQGIVAATSEALLATAWDDDEDLQCIRARQYEQRCAHLASLLGTIDRCRYAAYPVWRDYRAFVAAHLDNDPPRTSAALRGGRIERVDVHPPAVG